MNGPYGWDVNLLAANGTKVIAASTTWGLYRSTNSGLSWAEATNGMWNVYTTALGVYNQTFLAGASDGTNVLLFISQDDGASWEQVNTISPTQSIMCFTVKDTIIFAGTYGDGVYVSKDGGFRWGKPANAGLEHQVVSLLTVGSNIFAGTWGGGIYESADNGASWSHLAVPNYNTDVTSLFMHDNKLFMASGRNLFSSTDSGSTWSQVSGSVPTIYNSTIVAAGSVLYLASDQGVFESSDDGASWNSLGLSDPYIESICVSGNNLIAGTRNVGIFTSQDNGASWLQTGVVNNMMVQAITAIDSTLIVGDGAQEGVFISRDCGNSYKEYTNLSHSNVLCLKTNGKDVYAGTEQADTSGGGVFKSSDYGRSWQRVGLKNEIVADVEFAGAYLFAASPGGIFRTSNGGATWSQSGTSLPNSSSTRLAEFNSSLFAATTGGIFTTPDNGATWHSFGLGDTAVLSIVNTGSALLAGTQYGIFRSVPPDSNWIQVGFPDTTISFLVANDSMIFVGTGYGLFLSKSNWTKWASIWDGIDKVSISSFAIGKDFLFAGSWTEGVWRRPMSDMLAGVTRTEENFPVRFTLEQNYPNPFNPTTAISYQLSAVSNVTLKVYDVLGRGVTTLVNKRQNPGTYNVTFNATDLPSGVYFYRLDARGCSEVKKMLVLK